MSYFVDFDTINRKIIAFYHSDINAVIPNSAIEISQDEWETLIANPGQYLLKDGEIIFQEFQPQTSNILQTDWTQFNRAMRDSQTYQSFASSAKDKESLRRFETIAITFGAINNQNQDVQDLQMLWNLIAASVSLENKSVEVVEEFNLIAQMAQMPFKFIEGGLMTALTNEN